MGGLIVEVVDEGLAVGDITVTELRVKVVDCRSNENITKARTSRVKIICGGLTIDKKFDLEKDKAAISETGVEGSMIALQRLGYETATTATTKAKLPKAYDATWRGYYNNYWKARVPDFQDLEAGNPTPDMMNHIINEYNSHRATDDDGFLRVKIPVPMLAANTLSVEIGFFNFPVVQEATLPRLTLPFRRSDDANVETQFNIKWNGTQNITWNNDTHWGKGMGWEVWQSRTLRGELKVSETLDVGVFSALKVFNTISFSRFYIHDNNTTPHFVLIGMQWCQPVWDGIEDLGDHVNTALDHEVYIQDRRYRNLNMHIVTRYTGSDHGKSYGTLRHRYNDSGVREAIDIYTVNAESSLFAIHSGTTVNGPNSVSAGNNTVVKWTMGNSERRLRYLHMQSFSTQNSEYIMCGRVIGIAGRTGNLGPTWPCHVHLDDGYGSHTSGILSHRGDIDEYNKICIPCYEYPMLFPCYCSVLDSNQDPSNCNFQSTFANECWAALELRCPHMLNAESRYRRIQAQLRSLNYYSGLIDGSWGALPNRTTDRLSGTRTSIYNFKRANNLLATIQGQSFIPANYDIAEEDEVVLNSLAQIRVRNAITPMTSIVQQPITVTSTRNTSTPRIIL